MLNRILVVCLLLTVAAGAGWATTRNVPSTAYPTIQSAIDAAVTGDVVVVAAGTYKENIDFKGKAITVRSSNPTSAGVVAGTIIDGDDKGSVVTFSLGETAASVLKGFTITNGSGGGVYCCRSSPAITNNTISGNWGNASWGFGGVGCKHNSSPTITNNTISGNLAYWGAGGVGCDDNSNAAITNNTISGNSGCGVGCWGSSPTITNNTISGNSSADLGGGGVGCFGSSTPTITNNTISENSANLGGGVRCWEDSNPTITNNTISRNSAHSGGGVGCFGSSPTITNNTITGNSAGGGSGESGGGVGCWDNSSPVISSNTISDNSASLDGGGVGCWDNSSPTVTNNTISGNCAVNGGGVRCCGSSPAITNNTISGNLAASGGGGVFCGGSSPAITNNTISGNLADNSGGGVCCWDSNSTIINNTISGNSASVGGGGVFCGGSSPTITNTIIAFNSWGGGLYLQESSPSIRYCNMYGNTGGNYDGADDQTGLNGNISVNPLFAAPSYGNFRLKSQAGRWSGTAWVKDTVTSPCIDAGDPASAFAKEPAPNGGRVNMGYDGNTAYASKTQGVTPPTVVTIAPTSPGPERLTATASGATCASGRTLTYKYQWSKKNADGTWSAWGNTGQTLAASNVEIGDTWRVRAQSFDGSLGSAWKAGSTVTIVSMAGVTPAPKTYNVPTTTCVFATFRWPVQQSTVTSRVQLKLGTTKVIPTVITWVTAERKIKLRPRSALLPNTYYRINIDPGIQCTSGRVLGWGENYWFKTAPATTTAAVTVAASPTAAGAQFTVNLNSAATVRTMISNIAGRVIAELPERDLPSGLSSLLWNGRSNTGSKVPAGTYLVRVVAIGSEGQQTTAIARLQIR